MEPVLKTIPPQYRGGASPMYLQFERASHRRGDKSSSVSFLVGLMLCVLATMLVAKCLRQRVSGSLCPASLALRSRSELMRAIESDEETTIMYHAPWCGHCAAAKPSFEKAAKGTDSKMFTCNSDPQGPNALLSIEDLKNLQIEGFPAVVKYGPKNRYSKVYFGPRSEQAYRNFAESQ